MMLAAALALGISAFKPELPADFIKAADFVFGHGLPDTRGLEFRHVSLVPAQEGVEPYRTVGWAMPDGRAILRNGEVREVKIGDPVDGAAWVKRVTPRNFHVVSATETFSQISPDYPPDLVVIAMLHRSGWTEEAAVLFAASDWPSNFLLQLSMGFMSRLYSRAYGLYGAGNDRKAMDALKEFQHWEPTYRAVLDPFRSKLHDLPEEEAVNPMDRFRSSGGLEVELNRRLKEGPKPPLDLEANRKLPPRVRAANLIRALEDEGSMFYRPSTGFWSNTASLTQELILVGDPAIDLLFESLVSDERWTRAVSDGYRSPQYAQPAWALSATALQTILLPPRPPQQITREEAIKLFGEYRESTRPLSAVDRMRSVIEDDSRSSYWATAIDNLRVWRTSINLRVNEEERIALAQAVKESVSKALLQSANESGSRKIWNALRMVNAAHKFDPGTAPPCLQEACRLTPRFLPSAERKHDSRWRSGMMSEIYPAFGEATMRRVMCGDEAAIDDYRKFMTRRYTGGITDRDRTFMPVIMAEPGSDFARLGEELFQKGGPWDGRASLRQADDAISRLLLVPAYRDMICDILLDERMVSLGQTMPDRSVKFKWSGDETTRNLREDFPADREVELYWSDFIIPNMRHLRGQNSPSYSVLWSQEDKQAAAAEFANWLRSSSDDIRAYFSRQTLRDPEDAVLWGRGELAAWWVAACVAGAQAQEIPRDYQAAADFIFAHGVADPTGLKLHEVRVQLGGQTFHTYGWMLADGKRAILRNGLIYSVDWASERVVPVSEWRDRSFEPSPHNQSGFGMRGENVLPGKGEDMLLVALWMRGGGEAEAAAKLQGRDVVPGRPLAEMSAPYLRQLCVRAVRHYMEGHYDLAMADADHFLKWEGEYFTALQPLDKNGPHPMWGLDQMELVKSESIRRSKGKRTEPINFEENRKLPIKQQVKKLIEAMEAESGFGWSNPGGPWVHSSGVVHELVRIGDPAVPALLEAVEKDQRATAFFMPPRVDIMPWGLLPAWRLSAAALDGILEYPKSSNQPGREQRVQAYKLRWEWHRERTQIQRVIESLSAERQMDDWDSLVWKLAESGDPDAAKLWDQSESFLYSRIRLLLHESLKPHREHVSIKASNLILACAQIDRKKALPLLQYASRNSRRFMPSGTSATWVYANYGAMITERIVAGDETAKQEYIEFMSRPVPDEAFWQLGTVFEPVWRSTRGDPLHQFGQKAFMPGGQWDMRDRLVTQVEFASPLLLNEGFFEMVIDLLGDERGIGTAIVNDKLEYHARFGKVSWRRPLAEPMPVGTTGTIYWSDILAQQLTALNFPGQPEYFETWPDEKKKAAMKKLAAWLQKSRPQLAARFADWKRTRIMEARF